MLTDALGKPVAYVITILSHVMEVMWQDMLHYTGHGQVRDAQLDGGGPQVGAPCGVSQHTGVPYSVTIHELFYWVHQLKPLDLMGKPWSNYHLEMQLFWDTEVVQRSPVFCVIEDLITETNRVLNHEVAPSNRMWE